jgi:cytochrome c
MNKLLTNLLLIALSAGFFSCGGGGEKTSEVVNPPKSMLSQEPRTLEEAEKDWQSNKGIGPVTTVDLQAEVDQSLAKEGAKIYEAKCTACHKPTEQFIGPAPKGILTKRTPEWVMNMILNPEGMVTKDPIAKQLLIKFNGSPMANQNLTEAEARAVLEYFRTL